MRSVATLAWALALGCGPARSPQPVMPEPRRDPHVSFELLEDALSADLEAVPQRGGPDLGGFLAHRQSDTHRRELAPGCHTLTAAALAGVRDLDLAVYAPDGRALAVDTEPDAHPTVQLCIGQRASVWVHVEVYEGAGAYAVRHYVHSRAAAEPIASAIGGRPGRFLDGVREHAVVRRGFEREDQRERLLLDVEPTEVAIALRAGRCIHVRVQGRSREGDGEQTIQLGWAQGERTWEASPSSSPELQWCARADAQATLRMVASGRTEAVLIVWSGDIARVGGPRGLWEHPAAPSDTWRPGLGD